MNHPFVSVIMPVKDGELTIGISIASVLCQKFNDFEFIIVDDGSRDSTPDIIKSFADPRIRCITNPVNIGPAAAKNKAMLLATGEIFSFIDADDFWSPQYLDLVASCFRQDLSIDVVYADFIQQKLPDISGRNIYQAVLNQGSLFAPSVASVRNSFLRDKFLSWNPDVVHSEDDFFSFDVSKYAHVHKISSPLVFYGASPHNISSNKLSVAEGFTHLYRAYKGDIISLCGSKVYAKHLFFAANRYALAGALYSSLRVYLTAFFRYYVGGTLIHPCISVNPLKAMFNIFFSYIKFIVSSLVRGLQ